MKTIFIVPVFFLLSFGCDTKSVETSGEPMADMSGEESFLNKSEERNLSPTPDKSIIPEKTEKKIIKDGQLSLKTNDLEKSKRNADTLVKKNGAYYANESFNNTDYSSSFTLKIRIPSSKFEKFIAEIESGNDEVIYKNIDARDVTEEFIDLETRLGNKRNYLKKYNELLKQAKSVKEILEIEEKIRIIEEEIESTEGRLKYLNNQVDYSTLDLTLTKEREFRFKPGSRGNYFERLKQSLSKGWYGFVDFSLFILKLWPFWLIVAGIILVWRRLKKRNTGKRN